MMTTFRKEHIKFEVTSSGNIRGYIDMVGKPAAMEKSYAFVLGVSNIITLGNIPKIYGIEEE